jgi:SAM-dependent methyltransferase
MAVELEIDVQVLKSEIKKTYASVSQEPEKDFIFPTGRPWAEDLGYPAELANVPRRQSARSPGLRARGNSAGSRRVSGCSTSAPAPAPTRSSPRRWSANTGHVTGIDMTPEMLAKVRTAAAEIGAATVEFVEGEAEQLPFPDASFDVVISNGVIDLIPDKNAVFAEIFRVLTPAGGSRSPTSRSRTRSAPRAAATSTSGPAELPGRCWKQHTRSS